MCMTKINRRAALVLGLGTAIIPALSSAAEKKSSDGPMTRMKERELTRDEALFIIQHTTNAVVSTADKNGFPYGVPVTPVYLDGKVYFHGSNLGRKGKNIEENPNISICWIGGQELAKGDFAVNYASAIVAGKAHLIKDREETKRILFKLVDRHIPHTDKEKEDYFKVYGPDVHVWEVDIEKISGKARNKQIYFNKFKK